MCDEKWEKFKINDQKKESNGVVAVFNLPLLPILFEVFSSILEWWKGEITGNYI
jgi:hypothetical protein